jgi:NAD(P)-dependent dehydrogenase (short-subunit alcohol dehydrogenase family)
LTFAVNHLAHYLLARLLVPRMADHGRLVITTSDTHDPAVTPIAPKTLEPQALAHPSKRGFGIGHLSAEPTQAQRLRAAIGAKREYWPWKVTVTVSVGPLRCLATIRSASPLRGDSGS